MVVPECHDEQQLPINDRELRASESMLQYNAASNWFHDGDGDGLQSSGVRGKYTRGLMFVARSNRRDVRT
jgi:hypothetical protein